MFYIAVLYRVPAVLALQDYVLDIYTASCTGPDDVVTHMTVMH